MDNKNVILAVFLSTLILLVWATYFEDPKIKEKRFEGEKNKQTQVTKPEATGGPSMPKIDAPKVVTRVDALKDGERVIIENNNLLGSIVLRGALIDDVTIKNYRETIDKKSKQITYLNPKKINDGYFVETGWAAKGNVKVPDNNSIWQIREGKKLTPTTPVTLEWNNREGLIFLKKVEVDDKFLFKITDSVRSDRSGNIELFPYSQITRNSKPAVEGFYISHEGLIGVVNKNLKEESYDTIQKEKKTFSGNNGWLGITDKYWMTSIIPEQGKSFNAEFLFKDGFKVNYILLDSLQLGGQKIISSTSKVFIGAKEVHVIDGYSEKEKIERFDLAIDWGWFYFITKPLFFLIDYFFKLVGNFGIAIILLTVVVRIVIYPLADYSFKSMAKMKVLQPEMLRIKELYKNDVKKTQTEMMALYKREKVNPLSGCIPIILQIPIFFAVYKMLFVTIEMRHAPFFGWIKDLSAADPTSIFNLFGLIPWNPPTFLIIGVWPILMGVTMYIQQKLSPAPPDPIQAKIFAFFPLMLTILLASFPAGLVVYWTVSNVLTMLQQWIILKRTKVKTV
ncbi:MAG: membrane protein insertase YidC [Candidatus Fonsibacter sp.]